MSQAKVLPTNEYLHECLTVRNNIFYWNNRPESHFKTPGRCKAFNKRFAGKSAGCVYSVLKFLTIGIDGKAYNAHRLMYQMFKGTLTANDDVRHIDGNKLNNNPNNLEIVGYKLN